MIYLRKTEFDLLLGLASVNSQKSREPVNLDNCLATEFLLKFDFLGTKFLPVIEELFYPR